MQWLFSQSHEDRNVLQMSELRLGFSRQEIDHYNSRPLSKWPLTVKISRQNPFIGQVKSLVCIGCYLACIIIHGHAFQSRKPSLPAEENWDYYIINYPPEEMSNAIIKHFKTYS